MQKNDSILLEIKNAVLEVVPNAKIILFGSRVTGNIHEESDWDILVLTGEKYGKKVKWDVHDKLFPISIKNGTCIHLTFTSDEEWENGSGYYSLKRKVNNDMIAL